MMTRQVRVEIKRGPQNQQYTLLDTTLPFNNTSTLVKAHGNVHENIDVIITTQDTNEYKESNFRVGVGVMNGQGCRLKIDSPQGPLYDMPMEAIYPTPYENKDDTMQRVFIPAWTDDNGITYPSRMYDIKIVAVHI